ncbi:MAG TPA: hypothetical protein VK843_09525 [Planctomycetota bacterium]|nr:hypothetical protein [Planctomycetota bacterium]
MVVLGAVAGIGIGLLKPNTYASTTKLVLRSGAREQLTAESLIGLGSEHLASPPTMYDELQMLSDPAIFEHVALQLGPSAILEPVDPTASDRSDEAAPVRWMHHIQARGLNWLAERGDSKPGDEAELLRLATRKLTKDTQIDNEPGSSVIVIKHTSTSPERARTVAKTVAEAFIERHREQFSIGALVEASRIKLEQARKFRDEAASAYFEQVNKSGFAELDPQVPLLTTEITRLESELREARATQRAIVKQRAFLSGHLEDVPAELDILGPPVMEPNEDYVAQITLRNSLLQQRNTIQLASTTKQERERQLRVIDAQIEKAERDLRTMPKTVPKNSELRESNAQHLELSTKVEDLDLKDQELVETVASLEQALGEKTKLVNDLKRQQLSWTLRQRDLDTKREAEEKRYQQLLERTSALEALGNIDLHEQPNLRVLQEATLDREKIGPQRFSLLLKGLCAGLLAGLAFAVLRQRFDRRLLQPETFERMNGLPVLGVVPDMPPLHRLSKNGVLR